MTDTRDIAERLRRYASMPSCANPMLLKEAAAVLDKAAKPAPGGPKMREKVFERQYRQCLQDHASLKHERDALWAACKWAGICMACVIQAPDTWGCSDCLNTGWDGGARPEPPVPTDDPLERVEGEGE